MRFHTSILLTLLLVNSAMAILSFAQQPRSAIETNLLARAPASDDPPAYTFTKRVDEVNLIFTVTDRKGRLVKDFTASDLELTDNRMAPPKLRFFQKQSELPLRIALLIDASSSVEKRLVFEKRGAKAFLKKMLRPELDQAFVASFDREVHLLQDFTNDPELLAKSFNRLKAGGQTVLFDALVLAAQKLRKTGESTVSRRAIVLITDGEDNKSRALLNDAEQAVIGSDAVVYALSTNTLNGTYPEGEAILELLTRSTGGSILPARAETQFGRAFDQLEKALRSQYALGYIPTNFQADGSFHSVELTSRKAGYKVRCRRGYFAGKN